MASKCFPTVTMPAKDFVILIECLEHMIRGLLLFFYYSLIFQFQFTSFSFLRASHRVLTCIKVDRLILNITVASF